MSVELFLEETKFQGFVISFKSDDQRLSTFSSELTSEERELYRRSKNYGDVVQALVDYLCQYKPTHWIRINTAVYGGKVLWHDLDNITVNLSLVLSSDGVSLQFKLDTGLEVVFLRDNLVICPSTQQLMYYPDHDEGGLHQLNQKIVAQWPLGKVGSFFQDMPLICSVAEWSCLTLWRDQSQFSGDCVSLKLGFQVQYDDSKMVDIILAAVGLNGEQFSLKSLLQPIFDCCPQQLRDRAEFFEVLQLCVTDAFLFKPLDLKRLEDYDEKTLDLIRKWHSNLSGYCNDRFYLISVYEGQWVVGQLEFNEVLHAIYSIWLLMSDVSFVCLETLSVAKSDFHLILPELEQMCELQGYTLHFLKERVETERFDIKLVDELDLTQSIWDQITVQGDQPVTVDMINRLRLSDWVLTQGDKTVVVTPDVQKKIDALFMTDKLLKSSQKQRVDIPYRVMDMIYFLGLYQAGIKQGIPARYRDRIVHLLNADSIVPVSLPSKLLLTPRCYQVEGY